MCLNAHYRFTLYFTLVYTYFTPFNKNNLTLNDMKFLLWKGGLTDKVFVSKATKTGKQQGEKEDVTNQFLGAVIQRWENQVETIHAGNDTWEITVKKL